MWGTSCRSGESAGQRVGESALRAAYCRWREKDEQRQQADGIAERLIAGVGVADIDGGGACGDGECDQAVAATAAQACLFPACDSPFSEVPMLLLTRSEFENAASVLGIKPATLRQWRHRR